MIIAYNQMQPTDRNSQHSSIIHVRLSKELAIINITNFAMVKFANVCFRSHIKVTTGGF